MSYEPTVWKSGDVVTSAKLNKLEQGVAGGGGSFAPDITDPQDGDTLVYNAAQQKWVNGAGGGGGGILKVSTDIRTMALDKTWKEIYDALKAGYYVSVTDEQTQNEFLTQMYISFINVANGEYIVTGYVFDGNSVVQTEFITDSENGYPVLRHG